MKSHAYRILTLLLVLAGVAPALTGCGRSASPTRPQPGSSGLTSQAADDIARTFGTSLSRQHGVPVGRIGTTSLTALARGAAPRTGPMRVATEGGLSWSVSVTFYDADGDEQALYDPLTTARVVVHTRVHGALTAPEHHATVGIERLLDVAGLLPADDRITIDGAANDTLDAAFDAIDGSAARRLDILAAGALTDVVLLKDSAVNPYPLSGVARWHVNADASERVGEEEREAHYEATVVVTFNGTRYPTIEVSETWRYRLDLETGEVERV